MRRALVLLLALSALPVLAMACPSCKDALGDNPESLGFAKGIYYTVIIMPGILFSLVGFFIYKIVKEAKRETQPTPPGRTPAA